MDSPNETLRQIRDLIRECREVESKLDNIQDHYWRELQETYADASFRLTCDLNTLQRKVVRHFESLDSWLKKGGFLPADWAVYNEDTPTGKRS